MDDLIYKTSKNIIKIWKYYINLNKELGDELNYNPSKLIIHEKDKEIYISGILFENDLIVPVNNIIYKEKYRCCGKHPEV